jgi:hypothetical protein
MPGESVAASLRRLGGIDVLNPEGGHGRELSDRVHGQLATASMCFISLGGRW